MCDSRASARSISVEEAAELLGVEPAAVRMFVRERLLRVGAGEPAGVIESDVHRLQRVIRRQAASESYACSC
jgi:predicted transcriptional regulator